MRESLTEELGRVFEALVFHDENSFTFGGRKQDRTAGSAPNVASSLASNGQSSLVTQLMWTLYEHAYSQRFAGVLPEPAARVPGEDLTPAFRQANSSHDRWESGWKVAQVLTSGQIAAQCHGRTRLLWPGEFLAAGAPGALSSGTPIHLYWKCESTGLQPGFYFAYGQRVPDHQDESAWVRLYWHIRPSGAPGLLHALTEALNRFEVPFRFKLLTHSGYYGRSDAAVLYVARRYYHLASALSRQVSKALASELNDATPLFSKRLAPGIGFAEDPNSGESFGMHRCRLVAEALVDAFKRGEQGVAERLRAVERRFHEAGLSLEAAYLNSRSTDDYPWPDL